MAEAISAPAMSPPKIRRGTFCMAPKGLRAAMVRRGSGRKGRGTMAPPSRSAAERESQRIPWVDTMWNPRA